MRTQKFLSAMLALAIMLSCIGWTPTRAEAATLDNGAGTVTENIQPQTPAEGIDILQPEAAQTHVARLRGEEQENLNQQIFLNQDGSKTMYIYDHPVKYRDEQGEIHDISLDIADTGDAAYPYRTRANSTVTAFPAELSAGITLSGNGVSLRLAAQMPAGSTAGTTELVNHRVQRVDEQKVAYRYDADTTIEYALTYTGFKEDIVVNRYTGQTEYNFILYTNGLTLTQIGGGHYLTDDSGEIRASIGQIIVFTADERNNTFGQLVATTIKENQIYGMTIVLDADYLADPETKYPIRIDPTVSLTYADSGPDAIEDVVIQSKNEPLPQYGASVIGLPNKGISRLLVRFPGIDFAALEGVTVTSAALSIRDLMCEVEVMNVTCYPYTGTPWTETTAHWNTLNQSWGTALSSHDISYYDGLEQPQQFWYQFNITALAQQWVDGTADEDLGIILKASDAVEQDDEYLYKTFSSYERDSYKTYFTLTYRSSITLNRSTADVDVGDTLQLIAATIPEGEPVSWQSSDNTIATVSESGLVTGIRKGDVTITASLDEDIYATCYLKVVTPTQITISQTKAEIVEGDSISLEATTVPPNQTITWTSSDTAIATVTADGLVTGVRAGKVTITATMEDGKSASCTVCVTVEDGVYYIQNFFSTLYLNVTDGGIDNNTDVCQQTPHSSDADDLQKIRQMWKICHLGNGYYSIRPLHKMDMGLHFTDNNVDIYEIGSTDTNSAIPDASKWTIEWRGGGYIIKNSGKTGTIPSSILMVSRYSREPGETVILSAGFATETIFLIWTLHKIETPPVGMIVYDTISGAPMTAVNLDVAVNNTKKLKNLGFEISTYPQIYYDGMLTWDSVYDNVEINGNTNSIKGIQVGQDTIIASGNIGGQPVSLSIAVTVIPIETGTYFLVNKSLSKYVCAQPYTSGYSDLLGWEDFAGANHQKWVFTYIGDGMYTIHSRNYTEEYTDNHYLCIREGYTSNNPEVALHPGPVTDYMIWRIELTEAGDYRIIPKTGLSSGSVLSIASTAPSKVIHTTYTEDERYRCEWQIYKNDNIAFLLGIKDKDPDHDHSSTHYEIEPGLRNKGYTDIYRVITSEMSKQDFLTNLEMCEIFVFRGHGDVTGEGESYIVTDKAQTIKVKAGDIYDYANGVAKVDLSGCEILLFVACYTASGSQNIAEAAVLAGAKFAIGFKDEILCKSARDFVKLFVEYCNAGASHRYAAEQAALKAGLLGYMVYYPEFGGLL